MEKEHRIGSEQGISQFTYEQFVAEQIGDLTLLLERQEAGWLGPYGGREDYQKYYLDVGWRTIHQIYDEQWNDFSTEQLQAEQMADSRREREMRKDNVSLAERAIVRDRILYRRVHFRERVSPWKKATGDYITTDLIFQSMHVMGR